MTTTETKRDSLQRPKGRGFSHASIMNQAYIQLAPLIAKCANYTASFPQNANDFYSPTTYIWDNATNSCITLSINQMVI